ncbi:MAG TPA: xanthine dehydrogenase family protein molybdopterin-binding subunit [Candidatus Sulfotelmatobacter sp.]|nr:xanthine dehydrogenase family protein molybdopterin-binding subunit [Candidatus Sulfotelmatobacter sp.]
MSLIGRSIARLEDDALLRGRGRFVGDIQLPGLLHAAFVRSPHGHAAIDAIDAAAARALPGVHAVLTRADLLPYLRSDRLAVALPSPSYRQQRDRPVLAGDETVHVGEPIAIVVADSRHLAEDAAALVAVAYTPLPAVADCRAALAPGAPPAHRDAPHNLLAAFDMGHGDVEAAFAGAAQVVRATIWQHRGGGHSMECRGTVARLDPAEDRLTLWMSTQTPHAAARILGDLLGRDERRLRVITPDVGGGFGPKLVFYPEDVAVAVAALALGRPVKWLEDRREHFVATTQERDQHWDVALAVEADGRIRGVRGALIHDHGAYTARGVNLPYESAQTVTLAYQVPAYHMSVRLALTNKVPVTPVRGAGQPQGAFVMERLLDRAAHALGLDRAEIRRRNLVPASAMPCTKPLTARGGRPVVLDSGDYAACQADALARAGWDDFPARQRVARAAGRRLGIGLANFVKGTGRGPFEAVTVRIDAFGRIHVYTGAAAMGQSTHTMLAQIVAEQLGGDPARVAVTAGDTAGIALGFGGFNSRQAVTAGSSAHVASVALREKVLAIAAHRLEVAPQDLEIVGDVVRVAGAPELAVTLGEIARAAQGTAGQSMPAGLAPGLEASEHIVFDDMAYANGSAVAEVEVDAETGGVIVRNLVLAHDAGRMINPMIVDGQIVGGAAHGLGNALFEWMGFDENCQPTTTTLGEYLLVSATEMPAAIHVLHRESPSPLNPLGVKGVGECGVMPTAAAIVSAIENALSDLDVRIDQAPIRPHELLALIAAARRA